MAPTITKMKRALECPSAQPDMDGARAIGVIGGTVEQPRIHYLKKSAIVTETLASKLGNIDPTKIFRYAATCEESRCQHFSQGHCSLARRVAQQLPAVVDTPPTCQIRNTCRWHAEQGVQACMRCPQVITMIPRRDDMLSKIAVA